MQDQRGIRGDYFTDRLGGWTQVLLALTSLGIVCFRFKAGVHGSDIFLALLYVAEIVGAILITRSKLPLMRFCFWLFAIRVLAGIGYMGAVHGDKLARSTLGFPLIVAIYCWVRVRALQRTP